MIHSGEFHEPAPAGYPSCHRLSLAPGRDISRLAGVDGWALLRRPLPGEPQPWIAAQLGSPADFAV